MSHEWIYKSTREITEYSSGRKEIKDIPIKGTTHCRKCGMSLSDDEVFTNKWDSECTEVF